MTTNRAATRLTIADMMRSPKLLGASFNGPSWLRWQAVLKGAYAEPMDADETAAFREVAGRSPPTQRVKELVCVVGRGGGKDSIASLIAVHAAASFDPRGKLRPGEKAVVMALACDRHQAGIVFGYVRAAFEETPALKKMVKAITAESIELTNSVVIEIHTASYRSVRGRSLLCAVLDEIAFWRDDTTANPDVETFAAITPGLARVPNSMAVLISTAHKRSGLLWKRFREHYAKDSDTLVVKGTTLQFNPTFPAATIDAALQSDPALYGAEYNSEWRSDLQAFVSRDAVEACVVEGRFELAPIPGVSYQAFVDPSGGASDSMTLSIAHKQDNRVIVDLVREWKPPFSPEAVCDECAELLKLYGIRRVTGDRYGGAWVQEPFNRRGIVYKLSELEKSRLYQAFLPLVNSARVELLDLPKLKSQIINLERRTARGGRDSIDHPKGAHDDLANVVAGVSQLAIGPIPNPPAAFTTYSRYPDKPKAPHRLDGLITEGPFKGGYATST
jgi:hypothetical protein